MVERGPNVVVDQDRIIQLMERALAGRQNREGIFAQEVVAPEKAFVDLARAYGKEISSDTFLLHAVFFLSCTIFADDSAQQLKYVADPDRFAAHTWLFEPEKIAAAPEGEFIAAAKAFIRPGYNARALPGWHHNARLLVDRYGNDLRNFFAEHHNDAPEILVALMGPKRKIGWEGFHRFRQKIGGLFLQWVGQYDLAPLNRVDKIGIPIDFQVARLIIQTGGLKLAEPIHKHWILDKRLIPLLPTLFEQTGLPPQLTSETLWMIGSGCCNEFLHKLCPVSELCSSLISRERFDDEGVFDPKDVGRHYTRATHRAVRRREREIGAGQRELPL